MEYLAYRSLTRDFFGTPAAWMEKLRKPWPADSSFELVETSYYGFNIPEAGINGEIYYWGHPMLGQWGGGVYIFQGMKSDRLEAEYYDTRSFLPFPDDISHCTYANGVTIRMIKPLEQFEITFDDPSQDTRLRLVTTAIMPPAVRAVGGHFTQAMKNEGELVLNGREYAINGYFSRDRSWGDPRSERPINVPPITWMVGVFSDDLAFHVTAFDSPEYHPEWVKRYPQMQDTNNCLWGYLWAEGKLLGITGCRKVTHRAEDGIAPAGVELELTDELGGKHNITGTVEARLPQPAWLNFTAWFCLAKWSYRGRTGYGDLQDCMYARFIKENKR